ncbi:MAG: FIST N-terminal domain-containing protein [Campylobacterota bacterium]|nr:FIST N-terminal domain-containing protein [Campylobacterota bacterium]
MKTVNTYYNSIDLLEDFFKEEGFDTNDELFIQIFTGVINKEFISAMLKDINSLIPNAVIIGSTTDGEILQDKVSITKTVISITKFQNVKCKCNYINDKNLSSRDLGIKLSEKIIQNDTKVVISFADGLNIDGEQFLLGLKQENKDVVISGGLSGDNSSFVETFVFTKDEIITKGAVAVSLNGQLNVFTDYNFNWEPIGKELNITSSKDNIVYTIDKMSAYDTYKYYLGDDVAAKLPVIGIEFPLIIQRDGINIARAVTGVGSEGALRFAGDIHNGDKVRFGYGNNELILNSSIDIPNKLKDIPVESIFIYSCMARRRFMNHLASNEIEPFSKIADTAGFFTYGEFFTNCNKSSVELMNQTMTVLALSETDNISVKDIVEESSHLDLHTLSSKALSHLINVTSNELSTLNDDLTKSIKREQEILKRQETMLTEQRKMAQMGDMLGNIAHQWRQPLNGISVAMTSIQVQKDLDILTDDYFEETTNSILTNVKYLADTITTFREFIKGDKVLKKHSLNSIIEYTMEIIKPSLLDNNINIRNKNCRKGITINVIADEVLQVFINIITNAKDALLANNIKNGMIILDSYVKNDMVHITIEDNAGGIQESIINKIFDQYFTTKGDDGTGLGLHMSFDIIRNHMDGDIDVVNGKDGAIFTISLPIVNIK